MYDSDIAAFGFAIDSSQVRSATGDLDRYSAAGTRAEKEMRDLIAANQALAREQKATNEQLALLNTGLTAATSGLGAYADKANVAVAATKQVSQGAAEAIGLFGKLTAAISDATGAATEYAMGMTTITAGLASYRSMVHDLTAEEQKLAEARKLSLGIGIENHREITRAAADWKVNADKVSVAYLNIESAIGRTTDSGRALAAVLAGMGVDLARGDAFRALEDAATKLHGLKDGLAKSDLTKAIFGSADVDVLKAVNDGLKGATDHQREMIRLETVLQQEIEKTAQKRKEIETQNRESGRVSALSWQGLTNLGAFRNGEFFQRGNDLTPSLFSVSQKQMDDYQKQAKEANEKAAAGSAVVWARFWDRMSIWQDNSRGTLTSLLESARATLDLIGDTRFVSNGGDLNVRPAADTRPAALSAGDLATINAYRDALDPIAGKLEKHRDLVALIGRGYQAHNITLREAAMLLAQQEDKMEGIVSARTDLLSVAEGPDRKLLNDAVADRDKIKRRMDDLRAKQQRREEELTPAEIASGTFVSISPQDERQINRDAEAVEALNKQIAELTDNLIAAKDAATEFGKNGLSEARYQQFLGDLPETLRKLRIEDDPIAEQIKQFDIQQGNLRRLAKEGGFTDEKTGKWVAVNSRKVNDLADSNAESVATDLLGQVDPSYRVDADHEHRLDMLKQLRAATGELAIDEEEYQRLLGMEAEKYRRLSDPMGVYIDQLKEQAEAASATGFDRQDALTLSRLKKQAKRLGKDLDEDAVSAALGDMRSAQMGVTIQQMDLATEHTLALAKAYRDGGAAIEDVDAQYRIEQQVLQTSEKFRAQITEAVYAEVEAKRALVRAQHDLNIDQEITDAGRLADAWAGGATAVREATIANRALAQARQEHLNPDNADDRARAQQIAGDEVALDLAKRRESFAQMAEEQRKSVDLTNFEFGLLGRSNEERAKAVEIHRVTLDLQEKGADLTDAQTKAYIAQAGELAKQKQVISEQTAMAGDLSKTFATGLEDALLGKLRTGKNLIKQMGEDIERIFVRQTITKPFETAISGLFARAMGSTSLTDVPAHAPKPANDNDLVNRITTGLIGGLKPGDRRSGQSADDALFVQMSGISAGPSPIAPIDTKGFGFLSADSLRELGRRTTAAGDPPLKVDNDDIVEAIKESAKNNGVPEEWALALARQESDFQQFKNGKLYTSQAGAIGVMQLMPGTARTLGVNAADPYENIDGGIRYYKQLHDQFGDWGIAAGAYNAGPGRMRNYLDDERPLPGETVNHMLKVSGYAADYAATDAGGGGLEKLQEGAGDAADALQQMTDAQEKFVKDTLSSISDMPAATGKAAAATEQQAKAAVAATQSMTSGVQQALGGLLSLAGGATGSAGMSIGGATITAGGPGGLQQALGRLYNGVTGGSGGLGDLKGWLNSPISGYKDATATQAKLFGGDFDTAQAAQAADPQGTAAGAPVGTTWGQGIGGVASMAGGILQASKGGAGNVISGVGNTIAGAMMFTPLAWAAPIVSVVSSLIGGIADSLGGRGKPYSVGEVVYKNGRYTRGYVGADNDGDPTKYSGATNSLASNLNSFMDKYRLTATEKSVVISDRGMSPEQAMAQAVRGLKSGDNNIAYVLAHATADNINDIIDQVDFASKLRATLVSLKDSADGTALALQGGIDSANAFGKSILDIIAQSRRTFSAPDGTNLSVPAFASGTLSAPSGWALVGEEGPELVRLAGGERIWNARESARMLASQGIGADTELVHVRPDELAWMQRTLGGGRINPITGLPMFLEGDSGGVGDTGGASPGGNSNGSGPMGGENAATGSAYGSTSDRDAAYGGGWGTSNGGGGLAGTISGWTAAVTGWMAALAGWQADTAENTAAQTEALAAVAGLTPTAVAAALSATAQVAGYGITGMLEGLTGEKGTAAAVGHDYGDMGTGGLSDAAGTIGERATATGGGRGAWQGISAAEIDSTLSALSAAIKADPNGKMTTDLVGSSIVGNPGTGGVSIQDLADDPSKIFGFRVGDAAAAMQELDTAAQQLLDATGTVPDLLQRAIDGVNSVAVANGMSPVTGARDAREAARVADEKFSGTLADHSLTQGRYNDLLGIASSLQSDKFDPVGKDFQKLADDMTAAMHALVEAGKPVPETLYAAERQMEVLAAAKRRLEDQVAGKRDLSTDIQKQVSQIQGYWSEASTTLVEAFKQVGIVGDDLRAHLAAGAANALTNARNDYLNGAPNAVGQNGAVGTLNDLRGVGYLNTINDINKQHRTDLADRTALGVDTAPADEAYRLRIRQMLLGMSQYQRDQVAQAQGGDVAGVAAGLARGYSDYDQRGATARASMATTSSQELTLKRQAEDMARVTRQADELNGAYDDATRAIIRQTQALEDQAVAAQRADENLRTAMSRMSDFAGVAARGLSLQGKSTEANLLRFDISAQQQLYDARKNGGDVAGLTAVLAAERRQTEAESLRADYYTAIDRQTQAIQDSIDATTRNTGWLATVSENLRGASISARLSDSSPLSLEARLNEARRLFDETKTKFDDTTLPKAERQRLAGLLQTYGQSEIDLAHQYFGSTSSSDFERVTSVWDNISGMTEEQIDSTRVSLERQQEQIDELRRQRTEAAHWGEAQVGSINDLRTQTLEAFSRLTTSIGSLSPATSTSGLFSSMLSAASDQSSLDALVQYAKNSGNVSQLTSAYQRANDLGLYYGHYSYAGPGAAIDNNWDEQATSDTLGWLSSKGYSGAYDANANIFIQTRGLGDQFTNWISSYGRARGWMRAGGLVGAYADGGIVGNGTWDVDSVLARYAGGGSIALAGGEYVMPAHQTAEYLGDLEAMRSGTYSSVSNDNTGWRVLSEQVERLIQQNASLQAQMLAATIESAEANIEGHAHTADALRTSKIMEMAS
ncbi:transglycosylase SLT domain-containing protein [Azospirillum sp. TSO5]|uniref:transglycosylase SLT domain-containing protein n=1 Tax=Azospirillum sp. TSO5 TaxID=716760 RepID=UPI0018EEA3FA|nr:transglycosylase SLT domain-containing protein [Azospirillum sp. TSO5]